MTLNNPTSGITPALPHLKTMPELHHDVCQIEGLAMCASLICDYVGNDPRVEHALGTLMQVIVASCKALAMTIDDGVKV